MSEEKTLGDLTKVLLRRATSDMAGLPRRVLLNTAYWAGYASSQWYSGRARGRRALPSALSIIHGSADRRERRGTVARVNLFMVKPWAGERFIERFLGSYVTELQFLDGFCQAILARDQQNPDLYVGVTLWESLAQAEKAPDLPEDIEHSVVMPSKALDIVGRWFSAAWDGVERRDRERRTGQDRRQLQDRRQGMPVNRSGLRRRESGDIK